MPSVEKLLRYGKEEVIILNKALRGFIEAPFPFMLLFFSRKHLPIDAPSLLYPPGRSFSPAAPKPHI